MHTEDIDAGEERATIPMDAAAISSSWQAAQATLWLERYE
jgi:hypothetical protein